MSQEKTDNAIRTAPPWRELAPGIHLRSLEGFRVNTGLVIGSERALVIDTGSGPAQAREIYDGVRELTDLPLLVVNTHAHVDHYFGNAVFRDRGVKDFWGISATVDYIEANGEAQRALVAEVEPGMAAGTGEHTQIVAPNRVAARAPVDLDLGGISVTLFHLGRGHTDHDLLVGAGPVLFTGDLVEEGADPAFEDSYPAEWIQTLGKIVALEDLYDVFVPGHGEPVGLDFVTTQMNTMRSAIRVTKLAMDDASSEVTKAIPILPYGPEQSRTLLTRLLQLASWKWLKK